MGTICIAGLLLLFAACRPPGEGEVLGSRAQPLLPAGWSATSVGAAPVDGLADYDATTGRFTLTSIGGEGVCRNDGSECHGSSDEMELAYMPAPGDQELVVRLVSLTGTGGVTPRAGVVLRDGLSGTARMGRVFLSVASCTSRGSMDEFQLTARETRVMRPYPDPHPVRGQPGRYDPRGSRPLQQRSLALDRAARGGDGSRRR